jgi:hypothetical protein
MHKWFTFSENDDGELKQMEAFGRLPKLEFLAILAVD